MKHSSQQKLETIMNSKFKLPLAAAVVASLAGQANAGPLLYYVSKTASPVYLYANGGQQQLVTQIYIGPGTWTAPAILPAVSFATKDILRCSLWKDGVSLNSTAAMMGGASNMPAALGIVNLTTFTTQYSDWISLYCGHDSNVSGERIDPGAALVLTSAVNP